MYSLPQIHSATSEAVCEMIERVASECKHMDVVVFGSGDLYIQTTHLTLIQRISIILAVSHAVRQ